MWEDSIVAEVHRTREKLAAKFAFDAKAIFADLRERQTALGSRLVSQIERGELKEAVSGERQANGPESGKCAGAAH
jgi:hypothetical protein